MGLSSWILDHPRPLERIYTIFKWLFERFEPLIRRLGYERADRWIYLPEKLTKKLLFDCRMCGQCILHSTGMTCPMTCPKELRNGPCGGVRQDGSCEVAGIGMCIWVSAYQRSLDMTLFGPDLGNIQAPLNRQLQGSSAWINMLKQEDNNSPAGWITIGEIQIAADS